MSQDGAVVPLPFSPYPVLGENLHGYLHRLAEANGHNSIQIFLRSIKIYSRIGPTSDAPGWDRLVSLTLLPPKAFATMRWRLAGTAREKALEFLGTRISWGHLHPRNMRFCPSCLREDGIRRDFWSIAKVVACPRHATWMADACPGCSEPYSTVSTFNYNSCRCGFLLTDVFTKPASAPATAVSRSLAIIIGTKLAVGVRAAPWCIDLPSQLRGIGANDYLSYLELLGVAESTPEAKDLQKGEHNYNYNGMTRGQQLSLASELEIVEAGYRILQNWPSNFISLLERVDGRGQRLDKTATPSQAFSTVVGCSLRLPCRGENGLPLPLIHSTFDAYWRERHGPRWGRHPSVKNVNAKRMHSSFNRAALARAIGEPNSQALLRQVFNKTINGLTKEEKSLDSEALAELLRARSITLYTAASSGVTALAARRRLEGRLGRHRISGWNHPELLQPDQDLVSLGFNEGVYSEHSITEILRRLSCIAIRVDKPGMLIPLISVAIRFQRQHPALSKTDLLLLIFRGILKVYSIKDAPILRDLYVNSDDLDANLSARRARQSGSLDMFKSALDLLLIYHSDNIDVPINNILFRLARAGLIRSETRGGDFKKTKCGLFFHSDDANAILRRYFAGEALPGEVAVIGCEIDISARLRELYQSGLTKSAIAAELNRLDLRTVRGAAWTRSAVQSALQRSDYSNILAVKNKNDLTP